MRTKFTLTANHLKLLRRFRVDWQHCCSGAPQIDPKRPYGNNAVAEDIHEILTGETIGLVTSSREQLTLKEQARYERLHQETERALQIVLSTGTFQPGRYSCDPIFRDWRLERPD